MAQKEPAFVVPKICKQLGIHLIRDYLNFEPQNGLTGCFRAYETTFRNVAFCARITSVERKTDTDRLILEDGTSAILCVLKHHRSFASSLTEDEESVPFDPQPTRLGQLLEARSRRLINQRASQFSATSLGMTVFVVGELKEFQGKNLVWASTIRPVSEDYFARFLNFTIRGAEFRKANGIVN